MKANKNIKLVISLISLFILNGLIYSQNNSQTIRGVVTDRDSKFPIPGVNIMIIDSGYIGTTTNQNGEFVLENIPIGRHSIQCSFIGYKSSVNSNVLVGSGKEVVLNIEMEESAIALDEIVVKVKTEKDKTLNEMSVISARTFTVEETGKYAGSLNDPGRMALSFAGVSGGGNDATNEIVIRGNSPRGMLWQIEGMPVANPNHFGEEGQTGGGVCLLSNNLLDNSDFMTGAWSPGYGNALSGVFDIQLRNGNNRNHEGSFQLSTLGIDAALEGPIKKNWNGSYLINYRYSTFGLLEKCGVYVFDEADGVPSYQDLSFNFFLPSKKLGVFSLWGIMGKSELESQNIIEMKSTSEGIEYNDLDNSRDLSKADVGIFGLTNKYFIGKKSYLKTGLSVSASDLHNEEDGRSEPLVAISEIDLEEKDVFKKRLFVFTSHYNVKFNSKHTFRAGITGTYINYNAFRVEYNFEQQALETEIDDTGNSYLIQPFISSKYKFSNILVLVAGLHSMYYNQSRKYALEPRLALSWQFSRKHSVGLGYGLHSQLQPLSLYVYRDPKTQERINKNLDFSKARHYVLSYNYLITDDLRLKTDIYYQQLYSIPVAKGVESEFSDRLNSYSSINYSDAIDYIPLQNKGKGTNYGVEFTLEEFFSNNWYCLITTSLYESKYTAIDNVERNTRYNGNYATNILAGKEIEFSNKNILGFNARIIASGGKQYTPVIGIVGVTDENGDAITDFKGDQVFSPVYDYANAFSKSLDDYLRLDVSASYRINLNKVAHIISIDIQNATNRENIWRVDGYDTEEMKYKNDHQAGLIPVLKYRLEF